MFATERQQLIADLIAQRRRVSVTDLADELAVTTETVRRDLTSLENQGLAQRVHGGAIPPGSSTMVESRLPDRNVAHVEEKRRIAQAALAYVPAAGATIIVDAGSTTMRFGEALPDDRELTIMTNAVPIAALLAGRPALELHILPGVVRATTHAAVGVETVAALGQLRADVAFLGSNGVSIDHGLSTPDHAEAATKAAMVAAAHTSVLLCDSSKAGIERAVRFAELGAIDVFITDDRLPSDVHRAARDLGVEVVLA